WWTGWPLRDVRAALGALEVETVEAETGDGSFVPAIVLAGDVDPVADPGPWEALLPSLDPTTMGWKERSWYLGAHKDRLFDRNGNAGPTVWVDGRIVGGWAQRKDTGAVVTELLEPLPAATSRRIARRAAQLQDVLGDVRITPRFPTPVDKDLRK
ncbi:MAG: winged helix DNA-binding domain-containing protein, partial [Actinomycetota bacterium]|nr:winged helix DNA-binding domain-containing protein [Actinomycetota bacterium]